jgi:hypothetical protein
MRVPARAGRGSGALQALTSSALAITGFANQARADAPIERPTADYSFSYYSEDQLDGGVQGADDDRYEIYTQQLSLRMPFSGRTDLGLDLTYEKMSGASPWWVAPPGFVEPTRAVQVMSAATIEDARTDILLSSSYFFDTGRLGFATGYSFEKDYTAWNFGLEGERNFNAKNTTLSAGVGVSLDELEPTDSDVYTLRPDHENKQTYTVNLGLSQVLGRNTIVQGNLTYKLNNGYLADPYKEFVAGGILHVDTRPDQRNQFSFLTRLRRHFDSVNATFHADYQFYIDDWSMDSHTFELAWHQSITDWLRLIPSARYYSQSEADFYSPYSLVAAGMAKECNSDCSNDYRLSAFGAYSYGLQIEADFRLPFIGDRETGDREWTLRLGAERYESGDSYGFSSGSDEGFGLADFYVVTVSLGMRF